MKTVVETLRKQYEEENGAASSAWAEFEKFKKENGEEKIAEDSTLFDQAHELHRKYGEHADTAADLHDRLMKAVAMSGEDGARHLLSPNDDGREKGVTLSPVYMIRSKAAQRFVEAESYKNLVKTGRLMNSAGKVETEPVEAYKREELVALMKGLVTGASDTSGGALITPDRQAGMIELPRSPRPVLGLITIGSTDSDTVEWVRQTSRVNAAAEKPEATTTADAAANAPESGFDLDVESSAVREIKHYIPTTRTALQDAGQVRTLIEDELTEGLFDRLERQVLLGDGTGVNLLGILNALGGPETLNANASEPDVEVIHRALTQIALANYTAQGVLLHPLDWEGIRLAKDANGNYYYGPPSIAGPSTIWGYPSNLSANMPAGQYLVGNFSRGATLWMREGATIAVTDSHSDWFIRGIIAMLALLRAAFAVQRPGAFRKGTFAV